MEQQEQDKSKEEIMELEQKLKSLRANLDKTLDLKPTENLNLKEGFKSDGTKYSVRDNRDRFFYPNEWMKFFDNLKDGQRFTFDYLMNLGCRINEGIHTTKGDVDFNRRTIILRVTKVKAKKGEKNPRPRTIKISSQFVRKLNSILKDKPNNYQFGKCSEKSCPYCNNLQQKDFIMLSAPATHIALKNTLKKIKIKDWYMFSTHNIRKTHGNYLKALGIEMGEICSRLGHDYNTFLKSYVSADIFSFKDKQDMRLILGDLYQNDR